MISFFSKYNTLYKDILLLMSWGVLSQIITFLGSPILTRIYTPEMFGDFATFFSIVSLLGMVSTGKFEVAIMLPEDDKDSFVLSYLVLFLSTITGVVIFIAYFVFSNYDFSFETFDNILILLASVYVVLFGLWQVLIYLENRRKGFSVMGKSRFVQSISVLLFSALLGVYGSIGLVASVIIGMLFVISYLLIMNKSFLSLGYNINFNDFLRVFSKYKDFFRYSTISGVFNSLSNIGFPLLITLFFNSTLAGLFFFSNKIIRAPLNIFFSSISQVYYSEASNIYRENPSKLSSFTLGIQYKILLLVLPVLVVLCLISPWLFSFIFGKEWGDAGSLVKYYAIFIMFNSLYSPISSITDIIGKQRFVLFFNISIGVSQVLVMWLMSSYFSFNMSLLASSLVGALHFAFINIYIYYFLVRLK